MPSLFTITAPTNTVLLDNKRQGAASFTVSNISGRAVRGRARVVPENAPAASWLALSGDTERDFPIAGTQQYTVQIVAPPDAQVGNYTFRLDMVGVENPDEDFSQGPAVQFQVPEPLKVTKPFPWWIVAVVVALVVMVGAVFAIVNGRNQSALAAARATAQFEATNAAGTRDAAEAVATQAANNKDAADRTLTPAAANKVKADQAATQAAADQKAAQAAADDANARAMQAQAAANQARQIAQEKANLANQSCGAFDPGCVLRRQQAQIDAQVAAQAAAQAAAAAQQAAQVATAARAAAQAAALKATAAAAAVGTAIATLATAQAADDNAGATSTAAQATADRAATDAAAKATTAAGISR